MIATGSEVHLALAARDQLTLDGIGARVVSLPSTEIFAQQPKGYRDSVLAPGADLLAIEAGVSLGWRSYVGPQIAVVAVDTFGASAPGSVVMEHYGFSVSNVCDKARAVIAHEYQS